VVAAEEVERPVRPQPQRDLHAEADKVCYKVVRPCDLRAPPF
jgi:hypothetical protein